MKFGVRQHKRRTAKLVSVLLLSLLMSVLASSVVLAFLYRAQVSVTESASTSYTMLPVLWTQNNTWLRDNGFFTTATALDTRVQTLSGSNKPWLVANDKTLTATPVPADSQTNLYFVTGESAVASMDIITGYNGYVTVADAAAIEPGNDASWDIPGYYDTTTGTSKNSIHKQDAFRVWVSAAGELTAGILNVGAPASVNLLPDGAGAFTNITSQNPAATFHWDKMDDPVGAPDDAATTVYTSSLIAQRDSYTLSTAGAIPTVSTRISSVVVYFRLLGDGANQLTAVPYLRLSGADTVGAPQNQVAAAWFTWNQTLARPGGGSWEWDDLESLEAGISLLVAGGGVATATQVYVVVNYTPGVSVTATGVTSQYLSTMNVTLTGGNFSIEARNSAGALIDSDAVATAASIPDTAYDWLLFQNNVNPYVTSYRQEVASTSTALVVYDPVNIILGVAYSAGTAAFTNASNQVVGTATTWASTMVGASIKYNADNIWHTVLSVEDTTHLTLTAVYSGAGGAAAAYTMASRLPDTAGATQDGAITWGANPAGVGVTLGSMTSAGQPSIGGTLDTSTRDLLPVVGGKDWRPVAGVSATLLANPMRPLVTAISDNTTLSEYQVWVWFGIIFVVLILAFTASRVRGHHLITGVAVTAAIILLVVWTVFPWWTLFIAAVAIGFGLVSERSPSL